MNKDILAQKEAEVAALADKMKAASSIVMVEYRGLTVKEVTELRRNLRDEDVDFKVYKNAIARRAASQLGYDAFSDQLVGPNALAFGKDPVAPARVLAKFAKEHDKLVLKTGVVDGDVVDTDVIMKLSALPNKEGMLAKFASCLNAPVIKFAMTIKALAEAKENGTVKTAEAEEAAPQESADKPAEEAAAE
ncbi:50S ribosomal protein L10 [Catenisphaera adipataccumulans]|jgi:large subunit ribosomal protein L10|uniref:Large ribosomal subunit protein uL10 n=1 Tax=Catenisphaera adipataccumulans TaxID=700500 RepID=A0A7W8D015_9FIRM|nr:50S ribosomal protein L10 [Catenisphaera adipataccumulans]MBB5183514.1 large subunit ribosomal protein L10 [Catenisphaera adipataccumulans]